MCYICSTGRPPFFTHWFFLVHLLWLSTRILLITFFTEIKSIKSLQMKDNALPEVDLFGVNALEFIQLAILSMATTIRDRRKNKLSNFKFIAFERELKQLEKVLLTYSQHDFDRLLTDD